MFDVDVTYLGRRYTVTFAGSEPGARAADARRLNAGGHTSRIDLSGVTGIAVVRLAREKAADGT